MTPADRTRAVCVGLAVAVMTSALAAIYAKHQSRKLFVQLQALVVERDRLEMDWGRLQIEQSTQASHARVEQIARERKAMRNPAPAEIELVAR